MSAIFDFHDECKLKTYINGFLELECPYFDLKHGFLSSIVAEMFFAETGSKFSFTAFYVHPLIFKVAPYPNLA